MDKSINWPFHDFILNLFGTWAYTTVLEWELTWTSWILKWFLWKKGGILCDILWDGLGRVCPRFWEMGVLDIRRTLWLYFLLESFLYPSKASRGSWHSVTACRRPVTLASHIKELLLKIWDRWGSIRISDIYFAPEWCIWCCSSLRWCFFFLVNLNAKK